jgi:uncharacterized protein with GYD domain
VSAPVRWWYPHQQLRAVSQVLWCIIPRQHEGGRAANGVHRRDAARAYIEQVGGALHGFWYGFGKYDGYAIFEAPDNVSVAGAVLAIMAGGALASVETTVLMTVEETLEALAKGKDIGYRRPGESPAT